MEIMEEILRYFPRTIVQVLQNAILDNPQIPFKNELQEIRIRARKAHHFKTKK